MKTDRPREKYLECPNCKIKVLWSANNSNRPFCSEQCRNKDFVSWANEEQAIGGNSMYDDILSGDLGEG